MFPLIMAQMLWFLDVQAMKDGKDLAKTVEGHRIGGGSFTSKAECDKDGRDTIFQFQIAPPIPLRDQSGVKYTYTCTKRVPPPPLTLEQLKAIHDAAHQGAHDHQM